jgi:hypothetical protein
MLVPAIAFAWWVVSMPPVPTQSLGAMDRATPSVRRAHDRRPAVMPVSYEQGAAEDDQETPDPASSGERVPVKIVTPEIVRAAKVYLKELLDSPFGAERSATLGGKRYAFVLEPHYHPPGFVGGPHGWHKGVTVYEVR